MSYTNSGYTQIMNVPSHAAGMRGRRENYAMRQSPMGAPDMGCHFPTPAPHRVYCHPAAFHTTDGSSYHRMTVAYGSSRPLERYY